MRFGHGYLFEVETISKPTDTDIEWIVDWARSLAWDEELSIVGRSESGVTCRVVSEDLDGTVNRLGLIFFRIAMILSTLRSYEEDGLLQEITCSDLDFSLALSITETLKQVSLRLFYWFPETKPTDKITEFQEKAKQITEATTLRSTGMSYGKISAHLNIPKTTVFRWLNA